MIRPIAATAAIAAAVTAAPALAGGFADPAALDLAVAGFTGAPIGAAGGARLPVDRRLRLARCDVPLALEWHGGARESVRVRCPAPGGWLIFVPTRPASPARGGETAVSRGDAVTIAVQGMGFTLSRRGEALASGAPGEWIRVRPAGSGADPIRARILRPGVVGMDLP